MKKRVLALVMAVLLVLTAASCSKKVKETIETKVETPSIESVFADFAEAFVAGDFEKASQYTAQPENFLMMHESAIKSFASEFELGSILGENVATKAFDSFYAEITKQMLMKYKFGEVTDITINGDSGVLTVPLSVPDSVEVWKGVYKNVLDLEQIDNKIASLLLNIFSSTQEEDRWITSFLDVFKDTFIAELESPDCVRVEKTITVEFEKVENEWRISETGYMKIFGATLNVVK